MWFEKQQFTQLDSDNCVFVKKRDSVNADGSPRTEMLLVGCYVDDLFVLYSHDDPTSLYAEFASALQRDWKAEDEGEITDLLNVEINAAHGVVTLTQTGYTSSMANEHL